MWIRSCRHWVLAGLVVGGCLGAVRVFLPPDPAGRHIKQGQFEQLISMKDREGRPALKDARISRHDADSDLLTATVSSAPPYGQRYPVEFDGERLIVWHLAPRPYSGEQTLAEYLHTAADVPAGIAWWREDRVIVPGYALIGGALIGSFMPLLLALLGHGVEQDRSIVLRWHHHRVQRNTIIAWGLFAALSIMAAVRGADVNTTNDAPFFTLPESRLRELEVAIIALPTAKTTLEGFELSPLEQHFVKARQAYREVSEFDTVANLKEFYEAAKAAYNAHPDSLVLAGLYGYAALYFRGPEESIRILSAVADQWDLAPGIPISLYRAFSTLAARLESIPKDAALGPRFPLSGERAEALKEAKALAHVWAQRVDRGNARRLYTPPLAKFAESPLSDYEIDLSSRAWHEIQGRRAASDAEQATKQEQIRQFQEQEGQTSQRLAERERLADEAFQRALASVLELREGDRSLRQLELKFASLQPFRGRLRQEFPRVPHYDIFAQDAATKADADLIDATYQLSVLRNPERTLEVVRKIPSWQEDGRALYLAAFASAQLKKWDEAEALVKSLIEQNPKDYRAKRFLLTIEEQRERESATQPATDPAH